MQTVDSQLKDVLDELGVNVVIRGKGGTLHLVKGGVQLGYVNAKITKPPISGLYGYSFSQEGKKVHAVPEQQVEEAANNLRRQHGLSEGVQPYLVGGGNTGRGFVAITTLRAAEAILRAETATLVESRPLTLDTLVVGRAYSRKDDLHKTFGGSEQSGIASVPRSAAIFIFTDSSGEKYGYQDRLQGDILEYTGAGQDGDMTFERGNKLLRDHAVNGLSIHAFRGQGKGQRYVYLGEFSVASFHFGRGPDQKGTDRQTIVFHCVRDDPNQDSRAATYESEEAGPSLPSAPLSELRRRAMAAITQVPQGSKNEATRRLYSRSSDVRAYVLGRADGTCESCRLPAPFIQRAGGGYLEPHHTTRRSDGGLDHPAHVGAICPNCHREIHYGVDGDAKNRALIEYVVAREEGLEQTANAH